MAIEFETVQPQPQQQQTEKKERRIEFAPMEFKTHASTHYTSLSHMSKVISRWLCKTFTDIRGALVEFNKNNSGTFSVTVIMQDAGVATEGKKKALNKLTPTSIGKDNPLAGILFMEAQRNMRSYELTKDFKEVIKRMVYDNDFYRNRDQEGKLGDPNWNKVLIEVWSPQTNGMILKLNGLDIIKIIKLLYGRKNQEGEMYIYDLTPGAVIPSQFPVGPNYPMDMILMIRRTTPTSIDEARALTHAAQNIEGIPYYN